jgi:hypothetical protein
VAEVALNDEEASSLINAIKQRVDETVWTYPNTGTCLSIPLISPENNEEYLLDINRGRVRVTKVTFQNRVRKAVVLLRLDLDGAPHTNPDGEEIPCPHVHVYQEGYADKWAIPLPQEAFSDSENSWQTLNEFMAYANITIPPNIQIGVM